MIDRESRDRLINIVRDIFHTDFNGTDEEGYADFADRLLANGIIVPPCKVGDTVYFVSEYTNKILSDEVENIRIQHKNITIHTIANNHLWADEVFLTKEEAEQALKEREKV